MAPAVPGRSVGGHAWVAKLLPVALEASSSASLSAKPPSLPAAVGAIHIKLGHAQIRIEGSPDAALLRMVLKSLLR